MPNLMKMTRKESLHFFYLMDVMRRFEWDMHNRIEQSDRIPEEWHKIAQMRPTQKKRQVNIGLEEDVLKFFKSLGQGYGAKINLVLKSFMHARLAGILEGGETLNHFKMWDLRYDEPKPEFGFMAAEVEQDWQDDPGEVSPKAESARRNAVIRRAQARKDAGK